MGRADDGLEELTVPPAAVVLALDGVGPDRAVHGAHDVLVGAARMAKPYSFAPLRLELVSALLGERTALAAGASGEPLAMQILGE